MRLIPYILVIFVTMAGCHQPGTGRGTEADSIELGKLLHDVYQWHRQNQDSMIDFPIEVKDSIQTGLDHASFERSFTAIGQTGFFSTAFLDNYKWIADSVDHRLTTAHPPLLNEINFSFQDVDPWTESQEELPAWNRFRFGDIKVTGDTASLHWWFVDSARASDPYVVGCTREKGKWKISYLQGFDRKNN